MKAAKFTARRSLTLMRLQNMIKNFQQYRYIFNCLT